jgi:hypothetical protein
LALPFRSLVYPTRLRGPTEGVPAQCPNGGWGWAGRLVFGGPDVVGVVAVVGWVTPGVPGVPGVRGVRGVRGATLEGPWLRAGRKSTADAGAALPKGATMATLAARANRRLVVLLCIPPRVNTEGRPCTTTGYIAGLYPGASRNTGKAGGHN